MPAPFRLTVSSFRDVPVVRLTGGMVFGQNTRELHDRVVGVAAQGHRRLILDVSELESADSTGIGALLDVKRQMGNDQGRVFLLKASERLRASLALIRVIPLFVFVEDEAELTQRLDHAISGNQ